MLTKISVRNRQRAELDPYEQKCAVISISTPGGSPARIPQSELIMDILSLTFGEVRSNRIREVSWSESPWARHILPYQAEAIIGFWKFWREHVPEIVVHCDAGWSRSQGVAVVLCQLEGWDPKDHFNICTPDEFVQKKVLRAARGVQIGGKDVYPDVR